MLAAYRFCEENYIYTCISVTHTHTHTHMQFWGQRKRTSDSDSCFYWSLQRERDGLVLASRLLETLPHLSQLELTQGNFTDSLLRPLGLASSFHRSEGSKLPAISWNKSSGSCTLQPQTHGRTRPIQLVWWCSRLSSHSFMELMRQQ